MTPLEATMTPLEAVGADSPIPSTDVPRPVRYTDDHGETSRGREIDAERTYTKRYQSCRPGTYKMKDDANSVRRARLFRNGASQAVRIPKEFEFDGEEVVMRREGDRVILEPPRTGGLLESLRALGGWDEPFPDVDGDLLPLDDIDL